MCMQRMRLHALVAVLQAMVRGMQVRAWFRASLVTAQARIPSRAYFRRLADIGQLKRQESLTSEPSGTTDILAQQVRVLHCGWLLSRMLLHVLAGES